MRSPGFSVRPRTLIIAIAVILAATALVVWWMVLRHEPPGRVNLESLSEETTATVGLAGVFPGEEDEPLANPLGVVYDGETLFVAESDAGRVRLFDARGGRLGEIGLPVMRERTAVYPSSIALTDDDRLAIVDNAGPRVIVVSTEPAETADVLLTLGGQNPGQPTTVAFGDGEFYVFDAASSLIRVYGSDGTAARTIAADLQPPLAFATGMTLVGDSLVVVDSNSGRVLVLDPQTGEQRRVFGDRYTLPRAVVALGDERLAVIDTFERAVHITDFAGERLDAISAESVPDGPMASPRDAAWLSADSRLYVTDAASGIVIIYNVRLP